jgi:hypothetical protein
VYRARHGRNLHGVHSGTQLCTAHYIFFNSTFPTGTPAGTGVVVWLVTGHEHGHEHMLELCPYQGYV